MSPEEMRLFHHFTCITCKTLPLCPEPPALNFWARAVPQFAFDHGYLRSALLATSALHYFSLTADSSMLSRASVFYGGTLRALSKEMAGPSSANAVPLVMASLLTSLLSSRFTRTLSNEKSFTPALGYFCVAKGNAALLKATAEWTKESALTGYLELGSITSGTPNPSSSSYTSSCSHVSETSSTPKPSVLFVHQSGPALDNHAAKSIRSHVMGLYRSSIRKPVVRQSLTGGPNSTVPLNEQQNPSILSRDDIVPDDLLTTIAPLGDLTFSYLLRGLSSNDSNRGSYSAYVAQLDSTLLAIRSGESKHFIRRRCSAMPAKTPEGFIRLVEKGDERALVMMMHHYALLKLVDDVWWVQGTAEYNFEGLRGMVGKEWEWALEKPMAVMKYGKEKQR